MCTWAWILQRVSGVILVFALSLHWFVQHYISPWAEITFAGVHVKLQWTLYLVADLLLLVFAVFHGLNGMRTVVLDFKLSPGVAACLTVALAVLGILAFLYGLPPILAFLKE